MAGELEQEILNRWLAVAALLAVTAFAVPTVRHLRERPAPPPPAVHLSFPAPPGAEAGAGDAALDAAISPDQKQIAFVATTNGLARLWRRAVGSDRAAVLPGTEGAQLPAWKHTGNVVSFFAGGRLKAIVLAGGALQDLADAASPAGATWMPDGALIFSPSGRGALHRLHDGRLSEATRLRPGDRGHTFPASTGSEGMFTYVAVRDDGRRTIRVATGDEEHELTDTSGHAQIVGEHLLYVRDGVLVAQRFDGETNTVGGRAVALGPAVGVSPSGHGMFVASPRLLLFAAPSDRARDILWHDPESGESSKTGEPGDYWQVRLSPDGQRLAVTMLDPLLRTLDVMVMPAGGTGATQALTRALAADTDPVWSPDGDRVLFRSLQGGQPRLFTRLVGVPGTPDELLPGADTGDRATDWNGRGVLVESDGGATGSDIWVIDGRTGSREPIAKSGFNDTDARWSPDGAWVAYVSDESGAPDIYAVRVAAGGRVRVTVAGGSRPRWSRDGRFVFFARGASIMRAGLQGNRFTTPLVVMETPGLRDFDLARRSDRIVWLAPAAGNSRPMVHAVIDWPTLVAAPQ